MEKPKFRFDDEAQSAIRKDLFDLLEKSPLKATFAANAVKWLAKPKFLPELDIGFFTKEAGKPHLKGLSIFGAHKCVGFLVSPDNSASSVAKSYADFYQTAAGKDLIESGYRVVVLSPDDIKAWHDFYEKFEEERLFDQYGNRAHELSGIKRYSQLEAQKNLEAFQHLISNSWSDLQALGVDHLSSYQSSTNPKLKFDIAFLDQNQQLVLVPMHYVRERLDQDGLLVEQVRQQATIVP